MPTKIPDDFETDEWPDFSAEEPVFPFKIGRTRLTNHGGDAALRSAAASGDARATHDLALSTWDRAHANPRSAWPDGDLLREAVGQFRVAADAGVAEGMFALGVVECTVVGMKSIRDARLWFQDAVKAGHHEAQAALEWIDGNYREIVTVVRR